MWRYAIKFQTYKTNNFVKKETNFLKLQKEINLINIKCLKNIIYLKVEACKIMQRNRYKFLHKAGSLNDLNPLI